MRWVEREMQLAVNYSPPLAELVKRGLVQIDRFKCPSWPNLIAQAQAIKPVYVHFPLKVGVGSGDASDTETGRAPDWQLFESLLKQTDTPLINLHFSPRVADFRDIPPTSDDPKHIERLVEAALCDVRAVINRFGAENVTVENDGSGTGILAGLRPALIKRIVVESGVGFLFDLSHARLASSRLGVDLHEYIAGLPLAHIREIHLTGMQLFDEVWMARVRAAGAEQQMLPYLGRMLDHLPMMDADWAYFAWALGQIRSGAWATPWIFGFEVGGVGGFWEAIADRDMLSAQVPRLYAMVHAQT